MKTSEKGLQLIMRFERFRAYAYLCPANVWTIGYGHTTGVKKGDHISQHQAKEYLIQDVRTAERAVYPLLGLKQRQFDALVSFVFNVGTNNFNRSTLRKRVMANPDDERIATELRKWVYANGKRLNGLVSRREAEIKMYFRQE